MSREQSSPMSAAPVAWRYKCQDGSEVLMLKRLTDEQKRRGYYTGEDGEDEVDGDEAVVGPFHWAEETPLYAAPATPAPGDVGDIVREALDIAIMARAMRANNQGGVDVYLAGRMLAIIEKQADALSSSSAESAARQAQADIMYHRILASEARLAEAVEAIRNYFATFDRCGGSDSVSAEEFAERRAAMRRVVEGRRVPP